MAIILVSAYFQGTNIIDLLLENLKQRFYFEGSLLNGNLLVYLILNTLWFHLPLILMIVVSGMLTAEYKDRTLQTIMLQPVSKWKFILSKYIVAIGFTLLVVFALALSSFGLSYFFFGKGDLVVYLNGLNFFDAGDAYYRLRWSLGVWIRMHYVYPYPHVDDMIPLMSENLILPYLDVPFQHASPRILKLMKRPASSENNLQSIQRWREVCPDITIRSTFIVGFPGETEAEFDELIHFLEEAQLDRVGCFKYSPVDGASANLLEGQIPEDVKEMRLQKFMETQASISQKKLANKVGQILTVLVDGHQGDYAIARSKADAPDIDGKVYLRDGKLLKPGDFVDVKIESYDQHDLFAGPNV